MDKKYNMKLGSASLWWKGNKSWTDMKLLLLCFRLFWSSNTEEETGNRFLVYFCSSRVCFWSQQFAWMVRNERKGGWVEMCQEYTLRRERGERGEREWGREGERGERVSERGREWETERVRERERQRREKRGKPHFLSEFHHVSARLFAMMSGVSEEAEEMFRPSAQGLL